MATMNVAPGLLSNENRRKIKPKETPSCLIPRLLLVFIQQLEILVTTLQKSFDICGCVILACTSYKAYVGTEGST